jgi:hypothetical protein
MNCDTMMLAELIRGYPDGIRTKDNSGCLPLHWAVNQDEVNIKVVEMLLETHVEGSKVMSDAGERPLSTPLGPS